MTFPRKVKDHHDNVRELGCIITGSPYATIHHCHGGSMKDRGWHVGMSQKQNQALVIPLHIELHSMGPEAIDGGKGVHSWEAQYGRQVDLIDKVSHLVGYDLWELAEHFNPRNPRWFEFDE